jgi:bifunctional DNA-binding transcriptional regulator/antitoxin component of YhaV-PrlF toxin-antitoxin module
MTIPSRIRSAVGLADGDLVEIKAIGRKIVITPKPMIDCSTSPTADDEYTPAQRRLIDARLAKAFDGPNYGPFNNGAEVAVFLKQQRSPKGIKPKKSR